MTELPEQLQREHDDQCEATTDGQLDPRELCHCQDRADVAAAKAAGPVFLDLDDLDDLEDALHTAQEDDDDYPRISER